MSNTSTRRSSQVNWWQEITWAAGMLFTICTVMLLAGHFLPRVEQILGRFDGLIQFALVVCAFETLGYLSVYWHGDFVDQEALKVAVTDTFALGIAWVANGAWFHLLNGLQIGGTSVLQTLLGFLAFSGVVAIPTITSAYYIKDDLDAFDNNEHKLRVGGVKPATITWSITAGIGVLVWLVNSITMWSWLDGGVYLTLISVPVSIVLGILWWRVTPRVVSLASSEESEHVPSVRQYEQVYQQPGASSIMAAPSGLYEQQDDSVELHLPDQSMLTRSTQIEELPGGNTGEQGRSQGKRNKAL